MHGTEKGYFAFSHALYMVKNSSNIQLQLLSKYSDNMYLGQYLGRIIVFKV